MMRGRADAAGQNPSLERNRNDEGVASGGAVTAPLLSLLSLLQGIDP
jgi:hypothetical protein